MQTTWTIQVLHKHPDRFQAEKLLSNTHTQSNTAAFTLVEVPLSQAHTYTHTHTHILEQARNIPLRKQQTVIIESPLMFLKALNCLLKSSRRCIRLFVLGQTQ